MKIYNHHLRKIYCRNGKCKTMLTHRQSGGSIGTSLLNMGVKGAKRLLKNINFGKIAKSVFNTGKNIVVNSAKDIYNDNKDNIKKQAQDALESLVRTKGNQLIDGIKKSNNTKEALNSVKLNITNTPTDASTVLNRLVNSNKTKLTKSVKSNVSKNIKSNVSKDKLNVVNDAANIVSPGAGKILNNIIHGKGIKPRRRKLSGNGITIIGSGINVPGQYVP
jgi:hypothetical protein